MSTPFERAFVLEISGLQLDRVRERAAQLPHLSRFLERGAWGALEGPLQPNAPNCFATLYTGKNPGRTGLYDFFLFPGGGYERIPYSRALLRAEPFWELLSRGGSTVGLLALPLTHPLPELNGFVVSDDEGIGDEYAWPPELAARLRAEGYRAPFGASYAPGREAAFVDHTLGVIAARRSTVRQLFANGGWRLGMFSLLALGELLHAFWRFYDPRHPRHQPAREVFGGADPLLAAMREIDGLVGDAVELAGPRGLVIVVGAWGHRLEHSQVHLNAALEQHGWLAFKRTAVSRAKRAVFRAGITPSHAEQIAHRLNLYRLFHYKVERGRRSAVKGKAFLSYEDIDWPRTRAVAMGYHGQVYLNVRGRRPQGAIEAADYSRQRAELRALLAGLRDPRSGAPLVDRVFAREEIWHGEELENAPDLIVHLTEGYSGHSGISGGGRLVTESPANHSSDHWQRSAFLALGDGIASGNVAARLEDVAPTVLRALGEAIPDDYDGRALPILREDGSPPAASR